MTLFKLAIIADVHGNRWALDAVLEDIQSRNISQIINLGDCVYGPLDPAGTADRLNQPHILSIAGNMDVVFANPSERVKASPTYQYVRNNLTAEQIAWLSNLPATYILDDIFCCHGTPDSNDTSLLEHITPNGVFLASNEQLTTALQNVHSPVILCAHTHIARTVWLEDGRLVVNPGSVGQPAYNHDVPYPHKMESGSPHARYAVLSKSTKGWTVEQIAVPYDWAHAASIARQNGREDNSYALIHGRAGDG
jgi:putative phosphoesterase